MFKFIFFLILLCGIALGFSQLAELEGQVAVNFAGSTYEMPIAVAFLLVLAAFILLLAVISLIKMILKSPKAALRLNRERKKRKGFEALSQGLIAVTAGDRKSADYHAKDALRLLPNEPLALLLTAQSQQMSGNVTGAEKSFRLMLEKPETKLIGLKGLHHEAERREDTQAMQMIAEDAVKIAPTTDWAANSLLKNQVLHGQFDAAITSVDRQYSARLLDKAGSKRLKAVIYTAMGSLEALKEVPDFIPALHLAASERRDAGDDKRALKYLETSWKTHANSETAKLLVDLLNRDPQTRLKKAKALTGDPEQSALLIARIALDSNDFEEARKALLPHLENPRRKTCLLMAEIEMRQRQDHGKSREWTGKALSAKSDITWISDGISYDQWAPASYITGEIDSFKLGEAEYTPKLTLDYQEIEQKPVIVEPEILEVTKHDPLTEMLLSLPHPPDDPGPKTPAKKRFFF